MNSEQTETHLYNIGVSYEKANTEIRGSFSISKENQLQLLEEAKEKGIDGIFVLSTCNRTEIMGFAKHPYELISLLIKYSNGTIEDFSKVSSIYKKSEAIEHLFRTATGLDSQILGDYEIVGQLKLAFQQAKEVGTINAYLERLFNIALQASKEVKNNTDLSSGTTSVAYAAIQYITENVPNYNDEKILVYGLGKIGKNTCKNLFNYTNNQNICLINRTHEKALLFKKEFPTMAIAEISALKEEIAKSDILIVSTGAETPTITKEHIPEGKKLIILDLSIPENVDSELKKNENITLINVDDLSKITDRTIENRRNQIPVVENIIEKYRNEFSEWLSHRKLVPAINTLKESLVKIQYDEIDFLSRKLENFNLDQADILAGRIVQKITTQFVKHLKDKNTSIDESIHLIEQIFTPNEVVYENH
ncbi:MAG: glutamyl-tRNA reductase [Flavobacteriaceae bacterium]|nr:glutamyl-tRNA reductase [Flavobacteriaceae bacterium]